MSLRVFNLSERFVKIEKKEEEKKTAGMMEQLDRIERKLEKLQEWCEILVGESKDNYEQFLYQET